MRSEGARTAYSHLMPVISAAREEGKSLREIADILNEQKHATLRGKHWNGTQVWRVLRRENGLLE